MDHWSRDLTSQLILNPALKLGEDDHCDDKNGDGIERGVKLGNLVELVSSVAK